MNNTEPMDQDLEQEVQRLRDVIARRDQEIADLRSHLDKYQAVFSFSGTSRPLASPLSPRTAVAASKKRTRTRLFGISAEPAPGDSASASAAVRDLRSVTTFPKDES